jgi:hypothetical protein
MPLSRAELQRLLPKVGDRRMERPTIDETTPSRGSVQYTKPQRCVVVAVHPGHLWYTVQFENGIRESYKVPKTRPGDLGGGL